MADTVQAVPAMPRRTSRKEAVIALGALVAIGLHLLLPLVLGDARFAGLAAEDWPLLFALVAGGVPLVFELTLKVVHAEFGSDLLAGISMVTALILEEYLAGTLVVLMLSGGAALEAFAVRRASSVLEALARRMPSLAHRKYDGAVSDLALDDVAVGETLVVFPHEICPVDGTVLEGHGVMDESYLTGEPYILSKTPGSTVLSGAINGDRALTIRADKRAVDSRYAKIMHVMRESEQRRPRLRRLADQLGAWYTPLAVGLALAAWAASGEVRRFLAVLVVATPCPLLIAIPVAIIGSISLAARRGIIIKDPAVLEKIETCRIAIFDKTGTLTYGKPELTEIVPAPGFTEAEVLGLAASLERYSKHPLADAVLARSRAASVALAEASEVHEPPGQGLTGTVNGRRIRITHRSKLAQERPELAPISHQSESGFSNPPVPGGLENPPSDHRVPGLPPSTGGLECLVLIDETYAAAFRFRDRPRAEGAPFIRHLAARHHFDRVLLVSGDRESEVRYLAELVGIREVYFSQSPEQKLEIVRQATAEKNTVFLGDGINDAPALTAATVGIAFGQHSDITAEAAGAVIMESSLRRVDEFLHVGRRLRAIALQSAIGGMALSVLGMVLALAGYFPPVAGAVTQEVIDVLAVLNALRVPLPLHRLTDY
jgi:heavy metal translocating P-type ATPase